MSGELCILILFGLVVVLSYLLALTAGRMCYYRDELKKIDESRRSPKEQT